MTPDPEGGLLQSLEFLDSAFAAQRISEVLDWQTHVTASGHCGLFLQVP